MSRHPRLHHLIPFVVIGAVAAGCAGGSNSSGLVSAAPSAPAVSASASVAASASPAAGPAQLAADIDIGGRTLHLFCMGSAPAGTPTVIGESGLTGDLRVWNDLFYAISERTRICAYDRAGLNLSQPATSGPRTTSDQVDDLEALIAAAKLGGPFVLAGHSIGAWNVASFASRHPTDVAGIVLVDPRGPGVSGAWLKALPKQKEGEPEAVRLNREDLTVFERDASLNDEHQDLDRQRRTGRGDPRRARTGLRRCPARGAER